jgi:RNA-directed DNA polymerase
MINPVSTRKLCFEILSVRKEELLALVADANSYYKPYQQIKKRADGTSKVRDIEPSFEYLKSIQRKIDRRILKPAMDTLPPSIMGGRPHVSVVDNASLHVKSPALMKYDVKNFFPSIEYKHVFYIFRYRLNFCEEAANILAKLTTYPSNKPHLPQGAPTSTSISMFAIEPLCRKLSDFTEENNMKFSVWVDDMTISGSAKILNTHRNRITHIVNSTPFFIHPEKDSGIIKKGSNYGKEKGRKITGVTIDNTNRLTLGNQKYKNLKHRVSKTKVGSDKLKGALLFLRQVSPSQGRRLYHEYLQKITPKK